MGGQFFAGIDIVDQRGDVNVFDQKLRSKGWVRTAGRTRSRGAICTLCIAATNNLAQDRIGERRRQRLAVGEEYRFPQNSLKAWQAITLAGPVDGGRLALPCCAGKDLIKIDPSRGCRCGRKRLKRDARTDAESDDNCD